MMNILENFSINSSVISSVKKMVEKNFANFIKFAKHLSGELANFLLKSCDFSFLQTLLFINKAEMAFVIE